MRRLFLRRDDWSGYPLRKDFDESEANNPLRMNNETAIDTTSIFEPDADGKLVERTGILFEADEYVLNIGPQHPATHGVLRFRVALEGEYIKKLYVYCGYIHRGIEKLSESLMYPLILPFTERLDYLSAMQNRHALCMCIEQGLQMEIPERVQYIRTIMDELQRINSHLLFFSTLCMDLGALTAFFYGFRDREKILDIFEETTGGRLMFNYNVIGGLQADIHPNFVKRVKDLIAYLRPQLKEYHDVFTGNVITHNRMKEVGLLSREDAISFGATGGTGRASGWACDVRKRHPYAMYDKVDFKEIIYQDGDCFSRYMVRMDEIMESMHIIEQLIDNIPDGEYRVKTKPIVRLPEGCYYSAVEASRGEFGVYIESRGDKTPYRIKFRSTGLPLVAAIETIARDVKIADLIAIGGTLDYIVPDIDR
jgi:NADH-quinone oxidoreductase subunit C/D